jgi:hypothetical protein
VNPHRHAPENCPTTRCRYCDGTNDAWVLGEIACAPFVFAYRHPVAAVILTAAALVAAAVHGAF